MQETENRRARKYFLIASKKKSNKSIIICEKTK